MKVTVKVETHGPGEHNRSFVTTSFEVASAYGPDPMIGAIKAALPLVPPIIRAGRGERR